MRGADGEGGTVEQFLGSGILSNKAGSEDGEQEYQCLGCAVIAGAIVIGASLLPRKARRAGRY